MPTCGECSLLVKNNAGIYQCAGKQTLCFNEALSPETDARRCLRFSRKTQKTSETKQQ